MPAAFFDGMSSATYMLISTNPSPKDGARIARLLSTDPILQALTMLLLDRQAGATSQPRTEASRPGVAAGRVQLRLRADGRVLDLPPGKTTIGSSPRCNIRIEQPGVQPLHCLIMDGPDGLRVRSWAANTALNGVPFEESALAVGDCLSLGNVELEVFDPQAVASRPEAESTAAENQNAGLIRAGRDRARARSRQLLESLRRERTTHQEFRQQVAKLQESHLDAIAEQNEISGKLESCLAELAESRRQLDDYHAVETARQELAQRNEQLGFELGELSAQINELTHGQSVAAADRQRLTNEHVALREQHQQLIEANARLQSMAEQLANEKAAAEQQWRQLAEQKSPRDSETSRLADEKNALGEQNRQLQDVNSRLQSDVVQLANEKAAAGEQNRQLAARQVQLQNEVNHLAHQKDELEAEREGLRHQNEQLLLEARELAGERTSLNDERTSLCHERSELRRQNETLRTRIAQLDEENSAMAVGELTLVEQRDALNREAEQLRLRVAELSDGHATFTAARSALAEEQARLVTERNRLAETEHEMSTAAVGRENASAELYRALLQISELQEREGQSQAVVEAYELLSKEHDALHEEADKLREQIRLLGDERAAVEEAWQTLSDEAATLSKSQQSLADENAKLLTSLDEAKRQLERAEHERVPLTGTTSELERERAAKLQAEASVAAAIAEGERRLAEQEHSFAERVRQFEHQTAQLTEQSRQYAESISALEQQLAAAGETRDLLAHVREESELRLAEAESRRVEQSRQIQELEARLAAAEDHSAKLSDNAFIQSPVEAAEERPAGFNWSGALAESFSHDESISSTGGDNSRISLAGEAAWDREEPAANEWGSASAESASSDAIAADWKPQNPWGGQHPSQSPIDSSAFGDDDDSSHENQEPNWNRAAEPQAAPFVESLFAKPEAQDEPAQEPVAKSAAKPGSISFIEQYSHLFANDDPANDEKPIRANELTLAKPLATDVARSEAAPLSSNKTEDEDSIEQYMAKLLQRVRGDSPVRAAASDQSSPMPLNVPTGKLGRPAENSVQFSTTGSEADPVGDADEVDAQPVVINPPVKRRASSPAPATNLGALRALANETARKAISRHALVTLRRNAVTKTIVASLAGMTSLWLMLDSPDWSSVQFLTGCMSLLVAVFWAGETCRTLFNSMQLVVREGAQADESAALPIDVEDRA